MLREGEKRRAGEVLGHRRRRPLHLASGRQIIRRMLIAASQALNWDGMMPGSTLQTLGLSPLHFWKFRTHDNHSAFGLKTDKSTEQTYDCGGGNVRDTEVVRDVMDSGCLL